MLYDGSISCLSEGRSARAPRGTPLDPGFLDPSEIAIGQKRSRPLAQICLRLIGCLLHSRLAQTSLGPQASTDPEDLGKKKIEG